MPVHAFSRKTPLFAAFFCFAALSQGCRSTSGVSELPESVCQQATIPIAEVQGRDNRSPMQGQPVTVRGVVTWVNPDAGVFLEEVASDADQPPPMRSLLRAASSACSSVKVTVPWYRDRPPKSDRDRTRSRHSPKLPGCGCVKTAFRYRPPTRGCPSGWLSVNHWKRCT